MATDKRTRQVGGAGASCNPSGDVFSGLYVSAPNRSVMHTQALLLERRSPIVSTAREMMRRGDASVDDILSTMEDMDGDNCTLSVGSFPSADLRQYGIADFFTNGGYTGRSLETAYTLAGMADGTEQIDLGSEDLIDGRYSYHALGNDVAQGTVNALRTGFLAETTDNDDGEEQHDYDHCIMARRLMAAMDEVLRDGFGDMRCIHGHDGITATGAYLHVDNPDGRVLVHINKAGDGSYEPIEELKREFLRWQERSGCSVDSVGQEGAEDAMMSGGNIEQGTSGAEQRPAAETDESEDATTNNVSKLALVSVAVSSIMLIAVVSLWSVRSYRKQTSPDAEAIIQVDQHVWGV